MIGDWRLIGVRSQELGDRRQETGVRSQGDRSPESSL